MDLWKLLILNNNTGVTRYVYIKAPGAGEASAGINEILSPVWSIESVTKAL